MPESEAFDPTHALDGWRPPAPVGVSDLTLEALLRTSARQDTPRVAGMESAGLDPTHLLDGWRPPAPAPLDLDLKSLLRSGTGPDPAKLARLKARGYEMHDVEDVELVAPRPTKAAEGVHLSLPAEGAWPLFTEEADVVDAEVLPPMPCAEDREAGSVSLAEGAVQGMRAQAQPDPRLLQHWQPGAWMALVRQLAAASDELVQTPGGPRVEHRALQWLCAVWPPQSDDASLGRWPALAALLSGESMADALQQLLGELPDEAPLWPADRETDWSLLAELVLLQDEGLRPFQAGMLRELAEAERQARLARLREDYSAQGHLIRRRA